MKIKTITALCLCGVVMCASMLTACRSSSEGSSADEVSSSAESSTSATVTTEATETAGSEESTSPADQTQPATESASKVSGNSSNTAADSKTCIITVNNKDYTAKVGDVVTYSYYLKTPNSIENIQAETDYNGKSLKILDTELQDIFPVLGDSAVYNPNFQNMLKFNATSIKGYDFTKGGSLITLRFEVISSVNAYISTSIEIMDEVGGEPYVELYKISEDVIHTETLTQ